MSKFESPETRGILIVHGAPGAGKGTASERFAHENSLARHISAGDTIRSIFNGEVESPRLEDMQRFAKANILFPGTLSANIMFDAMVSDQSASLYLIDGFPQRPDELEALLSIAEDENTRILGAICLEVDAIVSIERMARRGPRDGESLPNEADILHYYRQRYERFMGYYSSIKALITECMPVYEINANKDKSTVYGEFADTISQVTLKTV
jgi:adenylate kinase family enzyme